MRHNPPASDFRRAQGAASSEILVALAGPKIIGSVMSGDDGHRAWIYYLAVDPNHQRRGLGAQLVKAAESWAEKRGVRKIQLMIRPDNEIVREFYQSAGFDETPRLVMAKWLDKEMAARTDLPGGD